MLLSLPCTQPHLTLTMLTKTTESPTNKKYITTNNNQQSTQLLSLNHFLIFQEGFKTGKLNFLIPTTAGRAYLEISLKCYLFMNTFMNYKMVTKLITLTLFLRTLLSKCLRSAVLNANGLSISLMASMNSFLQRSNNICSLNS